MSGPDSSPNFDWLTKGASKPKPVSPKPEFPSVFHDQDEHDRDESAATSANSPASSEQTSPPLESVRQADPVAPAEREPPVPTPPQPGKTHLLEEMASVPEPILNHSDGTTLIIKKGQVFKEPLPPEEFLAPEQAEAPEGQAASTPPEPPLNTDAPEDTDAASGEQLETEEQATEAAPADEIDSEETATFHVHDLIPPEAEEPETPPSAAVSGPAVSKPDDERTAPLPGPATTAARQASEGDFSLPPAVEGGWANGPKPFPNLHSEEDSSDSPSPDPSANESAVVEEAALPAPSGNGDQGRTEVLRAEDLAKAKQSWHELPTLAPEDESPPRGNFSDQPLLKPSSPVSEAALPSASPSTAGPSRMFVILASYASAITIAFLVLLLKQLYDNGHPHQLESLPDIATQKESELTYVPPYSGLPKGHTLHFGEKQRFGNIEVEPLGVVREPIHFVHYSGNQKQKRTATQPVWKIKLRFTNVSEDQKIAPLDRRLVLRWVSKAGQAMEYTNYFITEEGTRDRKAPQVQLYHLPVDSDWDMADQDLGKILKPGESYETYLAAAEEDMSSLPEDLVWRIQIRKGYSSKGHGVTTIFQVAFKKDDVNSGV